MTVEKAALRQAARLAHIVCTTSGEQAAYALNQGLRLGREHGFDFPCMIWKLCSTHERLNRQRSARVKTRSGSLRRPSGRSRRARGLRLKGARNGSR